MSEFITNNLSILAILWFFFAFIISITASFRKRSPLTWFFVGCVFGIFGIILLFLIPQRKKFPAANYTDKFDSRLKYLKLKEEFREYKEKKEASS